LDFANLPAQYKSNKRRLGYNVVNFLLIRRPGVRRRQWDYFKHSVNSVLMGCYPNEGAKLPVVILGSVIAPSLLRPQLPVANTLLKSFEQYTDGDVPPDDVSIATTHKQSIA